MPARVTKLPIKMNKGTTERVYSKPDSYTVDVTDAMAGFSPRIHHKPAKPTSPMAMAKGTRAKAKINMASRPKLASVMV